jgi:hypothetical protein
VSLAADCIIMPRFPSGLSGVGLRMRLLCAKKPQVNGVCDLLLRERHPLGLVGRVEPELRVAPDGVVEALDAADDREEGIALHLEAAAVGRLGLGRGRGTLGGGVPLCRGVHWIYMLRQGLVGAAICAWVLGGVARSVLRSAEDGGSS